jgi:SSS family solute:Na+ symporter
MSWRGRWWIFYQILRTIWGTPDLIAYVAFVIGIGWLLARYMKTSSDFLTSGRSIPTWVTGLAFISANLGALELVGMAASGAKYGIATAHFYWVGAIPAMVFLAVFMMPFYYGSKARSVPEYLKMRFDDPRRALNSVAFAVMTIFASGISMNALAKLLTNLLPRLELQFGSCVDLLRRRAALRFERRPDLGDLHGSAAVLHDCARLRAGGLSRPEGCRRLARDESFVAGVAPIPPRSISRTPARLRANAWTSAWQPVLAGPAAQSDGRGLVCDGLRPRLRAFFGYWCTNFLVVQRAMAAKNMTAARNTPLVAAVPKMLFPFLVIVPGMIAIALTSMPDKNYRIPPPIHFAGKLCQGR